MAVIPMSRRDGVDTVVLDAYDSGEVASPSGWMVLVDQMRRWWLETEGFPMEDFEELLALVCDGGVKALPQDLLDLAALEDPSD